MDTATDTPPTPPSSVTLGGLAYPIRVPESFAAREDIVVTWSQHAKGGGARLLRAACAALGMCTRLGRQSGADYAASRFDLLAYGGQVYDWMRASGSPDPKELIRAAEACFLACAESLAPREREVSDTAGFSPPSGAGST